MRSWTIVVMTLSVALASVPATVVMSAVYPEAVFNLGVNATQIVQLFQSNAAYEANPSTPIGVLGDFLWAVVKYVQVIMTVLVGNPAAGRPPAVFQLLSALGVPQWVIAIAAAVIAVALFRAMVYLVSGRNIDYV